MRTTCDTRRVDVGHSAPCFPSISSLSAGLVHCTGHAVASSCSLTAGGVCKGCVNAYTVCVCQLQTALFSQRVPVSAGVAQHSWRTEGVAVLPAPRLLHVKVGFEPAAERPANEPGRTTVNQIAGGSNLDTPPPPKCTTPHHAQTHTHTQTQAHTILECTHRPAWPGPALQTRTHAHPSTSPPR